MCRQAAGGLPSALTANQWCQAVQRNAARLKSERSPNLPRRQPALSFILTLDSETKGDLWTGIASIGSAIRLAEEGIVIKQRVHVPVRVGEKSAAQLVWF